MTAWRVFGLGQGVLDWLAGLGVAYLAWWLIGRGLVLGTVAAICGGLVLVWGLFGGAGLVWFVRLRSRARDIGGPPPERVPDCTRARTAGTRQVPESEANQASAISPRR